MYPWTTSTAAHDRLLHPNPVGDTTGANGGGDRRGDREADDRCPDPVETVFNFHCPPLDSSLDTCLKLDASVWPPTPVIENNQPVYYGAGSQAVTDALTSYQPTVGLHGHIHESRGAAKFKRTPAFNPGSEYGEGVLRGLIVAIRDGRGRRSPVHVRVARIRTRAESRNEEEGWQKPSHRRSSRGAHPVSVRVMSPYSAFIYNILTMGVIFPWTYLWAPTAFQGSNLVLGIVFAFLFELPIALAYVWLATSLPRSGGDYVFQSRVFGGGVRVHGRVRVLRRVDPAVGGAVGLAAGDARYRAHVHRPGGHHRHRCFTDIGTWAAGTNGIIIISVANALIALVLLVTGFRNYVRFQYVMWYAILLSFGIVLLLFLTTNPASAHASLDAFATDVDGVSELLRDAPGARPRQRA